MRFCLHPLYSLIGKKDVTGRMQQRDCEAKRSVDKELMPIREPKRHVGTGFRIHVTHELQKPFWHFIARDAAHQRRCPHPITVQLPTSITARSEPHHGFEEESDLQ